MEFLADSYIGSPDQLCALKFSSPFQLLVATILSAQCTDERVNLITPELFRSYPSPESMAGAPLSDVERLVQSAGFFRVKAKNIVGAAQQIVERGSRVLESMDDLVTLPGVGRKTANVVLSVGFGLPGLPVDTHVSRLSKRLGFTKNDDPERIERDLLEFIAPKETGSVSLRLILHGRKVCVARKPKCDQCGLAKWCPSFLG